MSPSLCSPESESIFPCRTLGGCRSSLIPLSSSSLSFPGSLRISSPREKLGMQVFVFYFLTGGLNFSSLAESLQLWEECYWADLLNCPFFCFPLFSWLSQFPFFLLPLIYFLLFWCSLPLLTLSPSPSRFHPPLYRSLLLLLLLSFGAITLSLFTLSPLKLFLYLFLYAVSAVFSSLSLFLSPSLSLFLCKSAACVLAGQGERLI